MLRLWHEPQESGLYGRYVEFQTKDGNYFVDVTDDRWQ